MIMKTVIASALLALSVLAGIASPAVAADDFNANTYFQDQQNRSPIYLGGWVCGETCTTCATRHQSLTTHTKPETVMKTVIASALLALSVLAGVAAPAVAADDFNANTYFQDQQNRSPI
jgi:hypothetical protein